MSRDEQRQGNDEADRTKLKRRLTLPLLTLYGLGVTIGAGIYVLVGATAAEAGIYAPISFLTAAIVVAFTGFSYAELGTRYPVSAGEAAYVRHGLGSEKLALTIGLMVATSGILSSAAVSLGAAAYLQTFIQLPATLLTSIVILLVGLIAIWGIFESVTIAAIFTIIEIAGLGLVIYFGIGGEQQILAQAASLIPPLEIGAWHGILAGSLLAFFAFVGFEDIANVAEEVKAPRTTLPRGIILTLIITAVLYFVVVSVVVLSVPMNELRASSAPLALMFENADSRISSLFLLIAVFATINGALIQVIMASRVIYGLARLKSLPGVLAYVNPVTRTPIAATVLVICIILLFAGLLPIASLAQYTSQIVLLVFAFVNLALLRLKWQRLPANTDYFSVPIWVPVLGLISCGLLLLTGLL